MTDVLRTIKTILEDDVLVEVAPDQMKLDDSLRDAYGLDSIGFVELRVRCEDVFGITIAEEDFSPEYFSTLGGVAKLVDRLLAGGPVDTH